MSNIVVISVIYSLSAFGHLWKNRYINYYSYDDHDNDDDDGNDDDDDCYYYCLIFLISTYLYTFRIKI